MSQYVGNDDDTSMFCSSRCLFSDTCGLAHDESPGTIRPIVDYNLGIRTRTNICTRNLIVSL